MRSIQFLFLAQTRLFWKARDTFSRLVFFGYRALFGIKHRLREEGATTSSLWLLLKLTLGDLVLAITIATVLQIINPYVVPWFAALGFSIPTESDYGTLLATVVGVGGVFIGLYYAAISAIGGSIYARVPNNIRDLLAQERVGGAYMRFLAVFTYLGVCLLAFHSVGLKPIILAVPLFLPGAGLAIIGFVRLGTRAFYLFDPTILSHRLFEELHRCHTQVQASRYRWSDQSFQSHARKRARIAVDTLTTVSDITAQETHLNGRPFADLCKNLLSFLLRYEAAKKFIPTDSLWYERRYKHPDWYRTDDTATSTAHRTATTLQPQSVGEPRWIELAILPIVQHCLEINIRENRYTIVDELLGYIDAYVQCLAEEQQVEFAFDLIRQTSSPCENLILAREDNATAEEPLEHIGIYDRLAKMPISVLVSYTRAIEAHGRDTVLQRIRRIVWKSKKSIYEVEFAVHVLERLEWLRPRLEFEARIEGQVVSPLWYIRELVIQKEVENLRTAMICFYDEVFTLYESWIKTATSSQHPWLAAVMISRESEYWHKIDYHTNTMNQLWTDLNSDRQVEGLQWPSLDTNDLKRKKEGRETELLKLMSNGDLLHSLMSRSESYPDFAGQFLHTTGEALLLAVCENKGDGIEEIFRNYFYGILLEYDRLRPKDKELNSASEWAMNIAAAPLLDLMDISGYAYLFSEYHNAPQLKEPIISVWDKYLNEGEAKQRMQFLVTISQFTEPPFGLGHRGVNRTRWEQVVSKCLKGVERREIPWDGIESIGSFEPPMVHKSLLVRIFARHGSISSYNGIDVFLAEYIRKRENGRDLDFGRILGSRLEEAMEWEKRRHAEEEKI